jgi:hypothetical protein
MFVCLQVTVGATLQLFGHTFKIPVTLQKLQLHTRVRAAAQVGPVCGGGGGGAGCRGGGDTCPA